MHLKGTKVLIATLSNFKGTKVLIATYYTFFIDLYFHRHFSPHNLYVFMKSANVLFGNIDITLIAQLIKVKVCCTVSVWHFDSVPSSTK